MFFESLTLLTSNESINIFADKAAANAEVWRRYAKGELSMDDARIEITLNEEAADHQTMLLQIRYRVIAEVSTDHYLINEQICLN